MNLMLPDESEMIGASRQLRYNFYLWKILPVCLPSRPQESGSDLEKFGIFIKFPTATMSSDSEGPRNEGVYT